MPETPSSPSFPSKHAVTSAAFATAVAVERPATGLWVTPLAAVVCYGRLRTRVHWPSDVYGGVVLGAAVAVVLHRLRRRARPGSWPRFTW
ncbi:phosphatase PAP2 family protein [Amycolatopsis sp. MEPSY49]|uniref:phosphatase PAP2 family protein n=1 Tax=Amycolatopsis sp. MEPSY49 TaxID=3151600 RepID=UPI003EF84A02